MFTMVRCLYLSIFLIKLSLSWMHFDDEPRVQDRQHVKDQQIRSYLSNRSFLINLGNNFGQPASASCGVPQDSILGATVVFNICQWQATSCQM